jgi:hypothetical protein
MNRIDTDRVTDESPALMKRLGDASLRVMLGYAHFVDVVTGRNDRRPMHADAVRAAGAFAVVWVLAVVAVGRYALPAISLSWARWLLTALLLPPTLAIAAVWLVQYRDADELNRRMDATAMSVTFAGAVIALMAMALLGDIGVRVAIRPLPALLSLTAMYTLVRMWLRWRYR